MANISGALMKLGGGALEKGSKKAIEKVANKAIEEVASKAANKAITKIATKGATKLTGAGMSSLAPRAGSTLDGVLGRSSGIVLPEANVTPISLAERTEKAIGKPMNTVGSVMDELGLNMKDLKSDKLLSKKNLSLLDDATREVAKSNQAGLDAIGVSSKSALPTLNRTQFYDDTLGRVGENGVSSKDVPSYMQKHLSNPKNATDKFAKGSNDEILRDLFQDQTSPISELYERYEELASGADANKIFTPDNIDNAVELANFNNAGSGDALIQDFSDRTFGNKRDIAISGGKSPAQKVKVSRATADSGLDVPMDTDKAALANKLADMKAELQTATGGGGMKGGGGTPTATASPDFGGLGDSGFKTNLNTGQPITVVAGNGGVGATSQQKGLRYIRDKTLKEKLNTNNRQFAELMGKSRSYGGYYPTVADRINAENISLANVADKTEAMLNHIEEIKSEAFRMADELGLTVDLNDIDNTVGLKPFQKKQLSALDLNLNDMIGDKVVSASQAEDIYRIMKGYAYDLQDPMNKPMEKQAGKALEQAANEVSNRINNTLDNMGVDYKKSFLDGAGIGGVGADGRYLRKIAESSEPFKFSDLRREESDWINIGKTAGNKMKEERTPESITQAIGEGLKRGGEKIKEKYYERKAYGPGGAGGAGGNMGGGSVPPTGGSGAENNINFETAAGGAGTLRNLLSKAKSAGLVGAGVLGGMILGGGGGEGSTGGSSVLANIYNPNMGAETEPEIDPYQTLTIGGYTYDQLENGYTAALMAGDSDAAKLIANMMGMLDDKIERYNTAKENSSNNSGIASKQRAALNVLSGLMQNYSAQGPIGGRFTGFMNALTGGGYNPAVAAYDSGASGSLGTIIKALGDTGALSEGDQKRALELLPKTTDSEEAAKYKYQQLIQILQGAGAQ